jgi:chromosome segregation ATPase
MDNQFIKQIQTDCDQIQDDFELEQMDLYTMEKKIKKLKTSITESYIVLRSSDSSPSERRELTNQLRECKTRMREFENSLRNHQIKSQHVELSKGAKCSEALREEKKEPGQMMHYGLEIQDSSLKSLKNTRNVIEQTKEIGIDINDKLEQNNHAIEKMHDNLESIDTTLSRVKKTIARIARKIATDKFIWLIMILFIFVIVFIICWQTLKK